MLVHCWTTGLHREGRIYAQRAPGPAPTAHVWPPEPPRSAEQFAAEVHEYLTALEKAGFSGVVLVADRRRVLLHEAYGYADRESRRRMTKETGFTIGSIVKPITRAAIVKLESGGKLRLTDPLSAHFDNVPPEKASITIQHVLDHKAGFPDIFGDDYEAATRDWVVRQTLQAPLISTPGTTFHYSNAGYSVLGAIIEKASGRSYERYVYEQILAPAGVKRIGYLIPGWRPEELAVGYLDGKRWGTPLDKQWMEDGPSWNLRANGGMLGTVQELYRWYEAILLGQVLSPEATRRYREMVLRTGTLGQRVIQAAGGNGVFNSLYINVQDVGLVFVLFTNASDMKAEQVFGPLRRRIAGLPGARSGTGAQAPSSSSVQRTVRGGVN
jgi:CubicO group peptidase (beta-lactamase class C family)